MIWIDIVVTLILIFSFIVGMKEGLIKSAFSLVSLFIAIPVTGILYKYVVSILGFIPDEVWQNFIGFYLTFIVISIILAIIFFIPRRLLGGILDKGLIAPVIGGVLSVLAACISLVLFRIVVDTYPIFDWLDYSLTGSSIISWLMLYLDFIRLMLPEIFRSGVTTIMLPWLS
jgi:membrane protein required for colicin V production